MEDIIITKLARIVFVGEDEYAEKKTDFTRGKRYYQELIYHFSGDLTVKFGEKTLRATKNTIRYQPDGDNIYYTVDREEKGDCIDIVFAADKLLNDQAFLFDAKNDKLANLFKKAFSVWVQKDEGYYMECLSLVYKIISEMQKTSYLPDNLFIKIKPAIDYIQANFCSPSPITATALENVCGISYSYVKKLFALKYKTSPKRYVLSLKMNYASDLLRHGIYSVFQVAERCGYNDVYTFSHQFKKEFGVCPSNFIKKYKSSK